MDPPDGNKRAETSRSGSAPSEPDPRVIAKDIESKVPSIRNVPETDRARIVNLVVEKTAMFSGPLPPPAILKAYDDVEAGLANRIVAMAESALAHEQRVQTQILESEILASKADHSYRVFGMNSARFALLGMLLLVGWLANLGQPLLAAMFGASSMAMIVWMFIRGQSNVSVEALPKPKEVGRLERKPKKKR
jgi:uncharacterized membrane protein